MQICVNSIKTQLSCIIIQLILFFSNGDCYDRATTDLCTTATSSSCSIITYNRLQLSKCGNQIADYFHARYRCVPCNFKIKFQSGMVYSFKNRIMPDKMIIKKLVIFFISKVSSPRFKKYNICLNSSTDITDQNGFIETPNYPYYAVVANECTRRIVAPENKIIKIWVNVAMLAPVSNK